MKEEFIQYKAGQTNCNGFLVYDPAVKEKRPAVIVMHAWMGQDDFARDKARELAKLGYVAFAADCYGDGKKAKNTEEATALMTPLAKDRVLFQERTLAAFETVKKLPQIDPKRIGVIGFCLGGLASLELLRTGAEVKSTVTFHSTLSDANSTLGKRSIRKGASILVLHGHDDPMVSQKDITDRENEFTESGADWEINIYGNTTHAFMMPAANDAKHGMMYNERTAKRAWKAMRDFFEETL